MTKTSQIVQEIQIAAPAARVFAALLEPEQRMQWWGSPGRFQPVKMDSDPRPGGRWRMEFTMEGRSSFMEGEYRVVDPPRLLEFTWRPSWYPNASESLVRFDLSEANGVTAVHLTHSGLITEADQSNHRGWPQILGWLRAYCERA